MPAVPKKRRYVNKKFLEFVRKKPCSTWRGYCGGQVVAHHSTTVKAGGSDLTAVPLCVSHHGQIHGEGIQSVYVEVFNLLMTRIKLLEEFIEQKGEKQ